MAVTYSCFDVNTINEFYHLCRHLSSHIIAERIFFSNFSGCSTKRLQNYKKIPNYTRERHKNQQNSAKAGCKSRLLITKAAGFCHSPDTVPQASGPVPSLLCLKPAA